MRGSFLICFIRREIIKSSENILFYSKGNDKEFSEYFLLMIKLFKTCLLLNITIVPTPILKNLF